MDVRTPAAHKAQGPRACHSGCQRPWHSSSKTTVHRSVRSANGCKLLLYMPRSGSHACVHAHGKRRRAAEAKWGVCGCVRLANRHGASMHACNALTWPAAETRPNTCTELPGGGLADDGGVLGAALPGRLGSQTAYAVRAVHKAVMTRVSVQRARKFVGV